MIFICALNKAKGIIKMNIVKLKGYIKSNYITSKLAEGLLNIYTLLRAKFRGGYTKYQEDVIVEKILKENFHIRTEEVQYIDIGANHFMRGNNTYLFSKAGANGILIEADPILCNKLIKKRKRDTVINAAIGTDDCKEIDFYVLSLPTRSSMDKSHIEQSLKQGLKINKVIKVPCINLNTLLDKYKFEPDYLSIDIEGMDYKVLRSINYGQHNIKVIIAERTDEKNDNGETMDDFMTRVGYKVQGKYGSNVIYVKN